MPTGSTARALSGRNRQEAWRERLRTFASKPPEEMGDEWGLFLKELGLTCNYFLAVCKVLKQGTWAAARNPRAYVKKAAKTEARKMHLVETPWNDTMEFGDKNLRFCDFNAESEGNDDSIEGCFNKRVGCAGA